MSTPKIAILTPTYNRPRLVERCIDSILNQEYENWEMYLVNDGSTEDYLNTESKIAQISKIKYHFYSKNKGVNGARNIGLEMILCSDCEYILMLDDDDQLSMGALQILSEEITKYSDINWFAFDCKNISTKDKTKRIESIEYINYPEEYVKKVVGDKAHVFKTCEIEKIRFPKFIKNGHENLFFHQLSQRNKVLLINKVIKEIEYQSLGLSERIRYKGRSYPEELAVSFLYLVENPLSLYYYQFFLKSIFDTKKLLKWIRKQLKEHLGEKYYHFKK